MRRAASVFQKYIRHPLEAIAITLVWAVFSVMPVDMASAVGGWIARTLGPRLPISNRARRNIRRAFPDLDSDGVENIVKGMWDNLGANGWRIPPCWAYEILRARCADRGHRCRAHACASRRRHTGPDLQRAHGKLGARAIQHRRTRRSVGVHLPRSQ